MAQQRAAGAAELLDYYEGAQKLSYLHLELVDTLAERIRQVVINWPRLVVDALEERIDLQGLPVVAFLVDGPTKHCRTYHPELSYEADSEFTANGSRHSDRTRRVRERERSAPTPKALRSPSAEIGRWCNSRCRASICFARSTKSLSSQCRPRPTTPIQVPPIAVSGAESAGGSTHWRRSGSACSRPGATSDQPISNNGPTASNSALPISPATMGSATFNANVTALARTRSRLAER